MKQIFAVAPILCLPFISLAATYTASTAQQIQNYTNMLQAGDTLLVLPGWYDMNWNIQDRVGNEADWIVILAAGDSVVINGTAYDNIIDVYNSSYIELKGFEITASHTGSGIDGIKFRTTSHHFIMEDLDIHDITGVGISANPGGNTFSYLTIRYCHIHDITDVGEGMYLGNHDGLSPVHHCIVEFNWVHDCHPHKGIQFKRGTYLNVIQDNVVYNCDEAGIVLYKTDQANAIDNNIVQRNVIWNCSEGIFAVGQTDIDNNVVFDCNYGINVRNYSSWGMEDLYLRNNTIYDCSNTCLRLDDWNGASGEMVCINNACYQDNAGQSAIQAPDGIGSGYVEYNRHYGTSQISGSTQGNPPAQEFINPSIIPGALDLYPLNTATLIDSGTSGNGVPADDFNWWTRPVNVSWDVGAYEWSQNTNPGWQIQEGFKEINVAVRENESRAVDHRQCTNTVIAENALFFENLFSESRISIYDTSGRLIHYSGPVRQSSYRISTSDLACAVYFYIIYHESNDVMQPGKFVLVR
jgi:parallel beta-helix repeat protein